MKCFFCKGEMEHAVTKYIVDLDECVLIVKNVPACVCTQCGERTFDTATVDRIQTIVNRIQDSLVQEVAIVEYPKTVA